MGQPAEIFTLGLAASNNHFLTRIRHLLYHSTTNSNINYSSGNLVNVVTTRSSAFDVPILRNDEENDSLAHHNSQVNMAMKQLEEVLTAEDDQIITVMEELEHWYVFAFAKKIRQFLRCK